MKYTFLSFLLLCILVACSNNDKTIEIIIPEDADQIEILSASELSQYLKDIYPGFEFPVSETATNRKLIYVGRQENIPEALLPNSSIPSNQEGFSIHSIGEETGVITAAGSIGLLYGVYELLSRKGYSFLYSGDFAPSQRKRFSFEDWDLVNEPLIDERTVFNWHNFLSGCTAWDFEDWRTWIDQSQKMGYNTIMVHGYANNPMFDFEYKGFTKPVGYLATSVQGRDWSTEHVNDVRRLPGGHIFDNPVFGSQAGMVPDEEKVEAVQQLMKRVFRHAESRGMKINLALDFDIVAAIPQEMVATIPETDKFLVDHKGIAWMGEEAGKVWLPRPDKSEGYLYYKNQVARVLDLYPEVDKYVLWRRAGGSVWNELEYDDLPKQWQAEYRMKLKENPFIKEMTNSTGAFGEAKLAHAYRKAFDDLDRQDVEIAYGTWRWTSLRTMNEFYPDFASIYILDSEVIRGDLHLHNQDMIDDIASWVKPGKLIPVIWPHHDDGAYLGAPLPAFENFYETLTKFNSNGFGLIHWMTRPFDMFFIHHNNQVQSNTKNQPLEETLNDLAHKWFGDSNAEVMIKYLKRYEKEMPTFGRETGSDFIDKPHYKHFDNVEEVIQKCEERIALLRSADLNQFSEGQKEIYLYYLDFEGFIKEFYHQQGLFIDFGEKFKSDDVEAAISIANQFQPASVLAKYAEVIQHGRMTKGEQGILFTMGVRWIPHFISLRQLIGLDEIRVNMGPTSHEDLAQMPGQRTYFIDKEKSYWKVLGEKETGQKVIDTKLESIEYSEIFEQGVLLESNMKIQLKPFSVDGKLIAGNYHLKLLLATQNRESRLRIFVNDSVFDTTINDNLIETVNILLDGKLNPEILFTPQEGNPVLCGVVLSVIQN